jgi:uncharacterized membrane protein YeaQ/YmgE (transglycosylase-associated protein family)
VLKENVNSLTWGKIMLTALLIALIIGAIAGWLAGLLVQGTGFGLLGDILVGIVGALMTSVLLPDSASASRLAPA